MSDTTPTQTGYAKALALIEQAAVEGWTELDLAGLELEELPGEIGRLTQLETLILGKRDGDDTEWVGGNRWLPKVIGNRLRSLPIELAQLKSLQNLNLSGNPLAEIPAVVFQLSQLECLQGIRIELEDVSEAIASLTDLTKLDLSWNQITAMPEAIAQLQALSSLSLSYNQITEIPDAIAQLQALSSLSLSSNQITEIPDAILRSPTGSVAQLQALSSLDLSSNQITEIPDAIAQLQALSSLDLSRNQITEIPDAIAQLQALSSLSLFGNQITEIPDAIAQLSNLKQLVLMQNRIAVIPDAIAQLTNLTSLYLSSNQIAVIPDAIAQLTNLTSLYLMSNQIVVIPDAIAQLQNLEILNLGAEWGGNQISEIPQFLTRLPKLKNLSIARNQIRQLPPWMHDFPALRSLDLQGNPIPIPRELLVQSARHRQEPGDLKTILNFYFQAQDPSAAKPLYEAKLLIIGEGGSGKTTLTQKLQNPDYELKLEDSKNPEKSTEGVEVHRWDFPLPDGTPFRVNLWDFGGQDIYHATHQFFLTQRSLYVLLIDSRGDLNRSTLYYWLNIVRLLGDNSPVFILKNEKQDCQCELNEGQLRKEFDNLERSVSANFATNRGLDDIKTAIQKHITHLPEIDKPWPNTWIRIRNVLENYSANFIPVTEYLDLCRLNGIPTKTEALQISRLLHDLGICLHFQDDLGLKNYVILSPTWATNAVYKVTDTPKVRNDLGRFSRDDLKEIWQAQEYTDVQDELLALMQKFAICYPLRDRPGTYIAPSLLGIDQPNYTWDPTDNLILRYAYDFMPKGILTRLIVEMHGLIEPSASQPPEASAEIPSNPDLVWKTGVILRHGNARAEVIENYNKSEITIRVHGSQRKTLLDWIRRDLHKIHSSYPRLIYDEHIPCNCTTCHNNPQPHTYPYQTLLEFLENRQYEIQCQKKPYKMVNVRGLINEIQVNELDLLNPNSRFSTTGSERDRPYSTRGNQAEYHIHFPAQTYQEAPQTMTDQSQKIQNFNGPMSGVIASDHTTIENNSFTQTNNATTAELLSLIAQMRQTATQLPQDIQEDLIIDLDDIETEIQKPADQRSLPKLKKRLGALIAAISIAAAPIAATTDFANTALDLGSKLGIELQLP